jgi:hypothetical protein
MWRAYRGIMENVESFVLCGWPQELIDQMYLDEDTLAYAKQREKGKKMKIKSPIDKQQVILGG